MQRGRSRYDLAAVVEAVHLFTLRLGVNVVVFQELADRIRGVCMRPWRFASPRSGSIVADPDPSPRRAAAPGIVVVVSIIIIIITASDESDATRRRCSASPLLLDLLDLDLDLDLDGGDRWEA